MIRTRWAIAFIAFVLTLAGAPAVAWADWSAGSAPGGNGAAAATTVDRGATPSAVSTGDDVAVGWAATTLANGTPVAGYRIARYDATTLAPQSVLTSCAGTIVATSCTESGLPLGQWVYSVTPVIGDHWTGAESLKSNAVTTDPTAPTNAISVATTPGNAVQAGDTVFYRGVAAGSFTLINAVSDADSGPASSTTSALGGSSAGWAHTPSTVSTPSGGPYVSNFFSWSASTGGAPTEAVTGRDTAGNSATTTMSFVNDSTAPTAGTVSYTNGYQPGQAVIVTVTAGTDSGSGIATRQLQRASATMTAGICGTFSGFSNIGPDSPSSPYTDSQVANGSCYQYRYLVTDRLTNRDTATSANVAKVDTSGGGPALGAAAGFSVLGGTGVVNTGPTTISGDVGVSPSDAISGFPPGTIAGTIHAGDTQAALGQTALALAYADAAARTPTTNFAGDLNGRTFHPGVHHTDAALALTGTLTLDADGDPNAIFIFQVNAAANTAAASTVSLINGAQASHVFWQVQGAVGTGGLASFSGIILAAGAITLGEGSQLIGQALSYGTVTLASNTIRFTTALPPVIAINGGATAVTKDSTPTISGTTDAPVSTTVTVTVAGQTLTTTVQTGGTWSVTAAALIAGSYNVVASVRDQAGNGGTASQTLTVELNPAPVVLGAAAGFSVLGGIGVANTGATTISGDLGVSPSTAHSGFPPGTVAGTMHLGDSEAALAQSALVAAYNDAAARTPSTNFAGDLNGRTFHAGVHHTDAALALTGTMTLDAEGDPNAVFIFQVNAAANTAASSTVSLVNGAQASNVFWQVQGAVGTGSLASFSGTILAAGSITLGADSQLTGRALTIGTGTVTLATNTIRFN